MLLTLTVVEEVTQIAGSAAVTLSNGGGVTVAVTATLLLSQAVSIPQL
jgi:hypothetical protein